MFCNEMECRHVETHSLPRPSGDRASTAVRLMKR
jgi:hypothetical protein